MGESCPNCGKPVLPADVTCWHCGYGLPARPKALFAPQQATPAEGTDYDFRALAVYGALTALIIVGLWLVMRSLGGYPILVRSAGVGFGGWVAITDAELRYTLNLPSDWQWFDLAYREQDDLLAPIIERQPYVARALRPLDDLTGDVELLGVAVGAEVLEEGAPLPLVLVGRSPALRDATPQVVLDQLEEQPLPVGEKETNTRLAGQPQARFTIVDRSYDYHCRYLVATTDGAYLVAACAPQARAGPLLSALDDILNSFQLLER